MFDTIYYYMYINVIWEEFTKISYSKIIRNMNFCFYFPSWTPSSQGIRPLPRKISGYAPATVVCTLSNCLSFCCGNYYPILKFFDAVFCLKCIEKFVATPLLRFISFTLLVSLQRFTISKELLKSKWIKIVLYL